MFVVSKIARALGIGHQSAAIPAIPMLPPCQQKEGEIVGRRHRIDTAYLLPKDELEVHRLDFQHYALRSLLGADYEAPLKPDGVTSILDSGCGTGRWSIEMAKVYPQAQIIGIDIEIPTFSVAPPHNSCFYEGNILKGIPSAPNTFDYVHQRLLVGAIVTLKWPFVIQELVRVTRVGGWVELLESGDVYHHTGPAQKQLMQWWNDGIRQVGFDLSLIPHLDILLSNAELKNITMKTMQNPLGKWAGRAGEMMGIDIYHVCLGLRGFYLSKLGIAAEAFDEVMNALPEEWEHYHTTYEFYLVYGQKESML